MLLVKEGEINRENLKTMVHDMCVTAFTENVDSSSTNDGLYLQLASKAAISFGKVLASLFLTFPHVQELEDDRKDGQDENQLT